MENKAEQMPPLSDKWVTSAEASAALAAAGITNFSVCNIRKLHSEGRLPFASLLICRRLYCEKASLQAFISSKGQAGEWITPAAAAELIAGAGLPPSYTLRSISRNHLKGSLPFSSEKIAGRVFVSRPSLLEWIEANKPNK